jgi:hypothetical protein
MLIDDDYYAISEYSNRRAQKRFVDSSEEQVLDNGVLIHTAFGNDRYRDIARKNMSADNTVKATLSVRANLSQSLILQRSKEFFVDVTPDMGQHIGKVCKKCCNSILNQLLEKCLLVVVTMKKLLTGF